MGHVFVTNPSTKRQTKILFSRKYYILMVHDDFGNVTLSLKILHGLQTQTVRLEGLFSTLENESKVKQRNKRTSQSHRVFCFTISAVTRSKGTCITHSPALTAFVIATFCLIPCVPCPPSLFPLLICCSLIGRHMQNLPILSETFWGSASGEIVLCGKPL